MRKEFTVFFLAVNIALSGNTYYVAPTGNDRNNGITSPFLTIQHGVNVLRAGDILYVRNGVYRERIVISGHDGTSLNPIVITAYPNENPIIDGAGLDLGGEGNGLVVIFSDYIKLNGFEIRNVDMTGIYNDNYGVYLDGHDIISNCVVHDTYHTGILACNDYNIIEYCTVYNCSMSNSDGIIGSGNSYGVGIRGFTGTSDPAYHNIFRHNTVHDVWGETVSAVYTQYTTMEDNVIYQGGIYVCNSQNGLYQRNFVHMTDVEAMGEFEYMGIGCADEYTGNTNSDNTFINNIVYGNKSNFFTNSMINCTVANNTFVNAYGEYGVIVYRGFTHSNSYFVNNIIIQENSLPCIYYNDAAGITFSNNLWNKKPLNNIEGGYAQGTGDVTTTVHISKTGAVTSASYYKLLSNSPAINAGTDINVDYDFYGNTRVIPDIGAFEFQSETVNPVNPLYVSSVIENSAPSVIEMNYDLTLANSVPATSAFSVQVNSVTRAVTSVIVSGTKVLLTLASPVVYGNSVTVAYTKPSANYLQTSSGGEAATISPLTVTNKVDAVSQPVVVVVTPPAVANAPPVVVVNNISGTYSGFVGTLNASGSYDANKDNLTYAWKVPGNIPVSATNSPVIEFLAPIVDANQTFEFTLTVSDGKLTQSKVIPIEIVPYKPELEVAEISNIEASSFQTPYYPYNIVDGNIGTMWSANGDNQWLIIELKQSFDVQHVKLAFQPGQKRESYFDILGSTDKVTWEPILDKSVSCDFSGDLQVFEFPASKTERGFKYIKLIGRCNSTDTWNYISELKIFGYRNINSQLYENLPVKIYPNPAKEYVTIRIDESTLNFDFVKITELSGAVLLCNAVDPSLREYTIPINLKNGLYIVQLGSGKLTLFAQKLIVGDY